uniref:N-terminal EF-hand calcium binding protein 3 n=1 Tax=Zonotrichia albicollis TaxID=44394 RepID=A0A8D2N4C9_ZONAL
MILHPVPEPRLSLGWDSPSTPRILQVLHGWSLFNFHFFIVSDDGKLSFDEFKAYFADGVLSGEELHELFRTIDTHNTDNLDTEGLCDCFSKHLGEYENVLSVLEDLNITILKAMDKTKKDYQEASSLEQFVTRFALKETLTQLQSLERVVESAEEQSRQERGPDPVPRHPLAEEPFPDIQLNSPLTQLDGIPCHLSL